jgi:hypothetical protein
MKQSPNPGHQLDEPRWIDHEIDNQGDGKQDKEPFSHRRTLCGDAILESAPEAIRRIRREKNCDPGLSSSRQLKKQKNSARNGSRFSDRKLSSGSHRAG